MSEYLILYTAAGSLLGLTASAFLYALGGRSGKWKRRFVASFILALTVNISSLIMGRFSFWLFFVFPGLIAGFSLGYGANTLIEKVIRRSVYALAICSSGLIFCLVFGGKTWLILPVHIGVGLFSVWLGVKNPIYAAAEEVFICALLNIGLCMYPFIG